MLIAQISDTHVLEAGHRLSDWIDTGDRFSEVITWINNFIPKPDVVLITGDLVENGTSEEYAEFRKRLAPLDIPFFVIPGNHDDRESLQKAFSDQAYINQKDPFVQYVIDDYPVRLIALDTFIPGEMGGRLCEKRLAWLEKTLSKETEKPTMIFMHHPPFNTGISVMDSINCENGDKMAEIIAAYTNIERVLCGHVHRPITVDWAGTIGTVAPSAAILLELNLNEIPPEVIIPWSVQEAPGFMLHSWDEKNGTISHFQSMALKGTVSA